MITPKYSYVSINRKNIDGKRHYCTPDGAALPSVTTILDRTKPMEERLALENWKKRVGQDKAQAITTEAANRGTRMHTYLEEYVKTGQHRERPSNPYAWASHAMAQTIIDQGMQAVDETWGVEVPMYFPNLYAGTTDCVGVHNGSEAIMDFKQSNRPKKEEWIANYKLQLVAYALAHNEVYGTEIRKGVILMCVKPELDEQHNIVTPPQYQEFILEGDEFDQWEQKWWKRLESYYLAVS